MGIGSSFSSSFSGLGFSSSFLNPSASSSSTSTSMGRLMGINGVSNGLSNGHSNPPHTQGMDEDDDFTNNYFGNPLGFGGLDMDDPTDPLGSLGGLDMNDDPLMMAIGGLSLSHSPSDSPTIKHQPIVSPQRPGMPPLSPSLQHPQGHPSPSMIGQYYSNGIPPSSSSPKIDYAPLPLPQVSYQLNNNAVDFF
jgi:hypothetical protein